MLDHAREDLLAFTAFPTAHWKKIWSTNPLEEAVAEFRSVSFLWSDVRV